MEKERPLEPDYVFEDAEQEKLYKVEAKVTVYVRATSKEEATHKVEYSKDYELENIEVESIEEEYTNE